MWDKDDPKAKWIHLILKLLAALIIFKAGVLVGEFKIVKSMVVGGADLPKMLFRGDADGKGNVMFFNKRVDGPGTFWGNSGTRQDLPTEPGAPTPP